MKNINWELADAEGSAAYRINKVFNDDTMMQFFTERVRNSLAWGAAEHLCNSSFSGGRPNYSQALFTVQFEYLPKSPVGVFGGEFHRHVAGLVQKALYPEDRL